MTTPPHGEMPETERNGNTDADGDAIMDTVTEAETDTNMGVGTATDADADMGMEIDANMTIPSPLRTPLYDDLPKVMMEIWKRTCAAPSSLPGVHIFAFESAKARHENPYLPRWMPLGPPRVAPRDGGYGWFFRNANIVAPSFDAHNPSTYLVDSGLWTACKQSRDFMLEAYGVANWNRILAAYPHLFDDEFKRQSLIELPVVVHFRDRGKERYFSLFPNKDLIYLQPERLECACWTWKMPLGRDLWRGHGLSPTAHEKNSKHYYVSYFAELATMVSPNASIWFVDERFKRKAIAPTQEQVAMELKRRVFYASDRRYVEIMGQAFPLDHDQWELLPQQILGMTDPPVCDPSGRGRYMWTWVEDFVGGDGLHWSGEWFIHTIQHCIKSKAKAQAEARAKAQAKARRGDADTDKDRKPKTGKPNTGTTGDGKHNEHKTNNGKRNDSKTGDGEPKDSEPDDFKCNGTEVNRFGILACEFF